VFEPALPDNKKIPTLLFLRMLYFSVSTATLCGTSEVEPLEWYANVVVSVQVGRYGCNHFQQCNEVWQHYFADAFEFCVLCFHLVVGCDSTETAKAANKSIKK
jgi:hypothetical protein